jgi:hypothetical protein
MTSGRPDGKGAVCVGALGLVGVMVGEDCSTIIVLGNQRDVSVGLGGTLDSVVVVGGEVSGGGSLVVVFEIGGVGSGWYEVLVVILPSPGPGGGRLVVVGSGGRSELVVVLLIGGSSVLSGGGTDVVVSTDGGSVTVGGSVVCSGVGLVVVTLARGSVMLVGLGSKTLDMKLSNGSRLPPSLEVVSAGRSAGGEVVVSVGGAVVSGTGLVGSVPFAVVSTKDEVAD